MPFRGCNSTRVEIRWKTHLHNSWRNLLYAFVVTSDKNYVQPRSNSLLCAITLANRVMTDVDVAGRGAAVPVPSSIADVSEKLLMSGIYLPGN